MIPADWGVEAYTTSELKACLAHVDEQLAGELSDRDRRRLTERRAAVLAEQEDRVRIAAEMAEQARQLVRRRGLDRPDPGDPATLARLPCQ